MSRKHSAISVLDDAIRAAAAKKHSRSWYSRLPPDAQKDFAEVKTRHAEGHYAGVAMSVIHAAVVARCKEESWPEPHSVTTVSRWLKS